jgi:hypothetical protein
MNADKTKTFEQKICYGKEGKDLIMVCGYVRNYTGQNGQTYQNKEFAVFRPYKYVAKNGPDAGQSKWGQGVEIPAKQFAAVIDALYQYDIQHNAGLGFARFSSPNKVNTSQVPLDEDNIPF